MKRAIGIGIAALVLVACKQPVEIKEGQLVNMGGFGYKTASQSGVTPLDGRFSYQKGETITVYLGDTVLGTVKAAETITLFDLFNGTAELPRNAASLRQQLRGYQGYRYETLPEPAYGVHWMGGNPVGVHWAANAARVLLAVDEDADLSNGVNLIPGDWHNKLKGYALDFNAPLQEFANQYQNPVLKHISHDFGISFAMDIAEPLIQLYDAAAIKIDGKVRTGTDSLSYREITWAWTREGQIAAQNELRDSGVDAYNESYVYDEQGNRIKRVLDVDSGNDGFDSRFEYNYVPNKYGFSTEYTHRRFADGDEVNAIYQSIQTTDYLDGKVFISQYRTEADSNNDGVIDSVYGNDFVYDDHLNLLQRVVPTFNADGTVQKAINYRSVFEYDDQSRLTYFAREDNFDEFGEPGSTRYAYNIAYNGNTVTQTAVERSGYFTDIELTYDASGRLLKQVSESYDDGSSPKALPRLVLQSTQLYQTETTDYAYDAQGRFDYCERVRRNADGDMTSYYKFDLNWNEHGLASVQYRYGNSMDTIATENGTTIEYGNESEWTSALLDGSDAYTYEYVEYADALAFIIHEFVDIEEKNIDTNFGYCGN